MPTHACEDALAEPLGDEIGRYPRRFGTSGRCISRYELSATSGTDGEETSTSAPLRFSAGPPGPAFALSTILPVTRAAGLVLPTQQRSRNHIYWREHSAVSGQADTNPAFMPEIHGWPVENRPLEFGHFSRPSHRIPPPDELKVAPVLKPTPEWCNLQHGSSAPGSPGLAAPLFCENFRL